MFPPQTVKPASLMTSWLQHQSQPSSFGIENACVLQDPNNVSRVVRAQQQDVFSTSIQSLLKDGCEVIQLGLSWQDRVNFVLANDFSLRSLQLQDEIIEQIKELAPETAAQQFDADLMIMAGTLSLILNEMLDVFADKGMTAAPMLKTA